MMNIKMTNQLKSQMVIYIIPQNLLFEMKVRNLIYEVSGSHSA